MPLCCIQTNTKLDATEIDAAHRGLSECVSRQLGKSKDYVMTQIEAELSMSFGDSFEPCAFCQLTSLGLDDDQIKALSGELSRFIAETFTIEESRIYIQFEAPPRSRFAWNGQPFG